MCIIYKYNVDGCIHMYTLYDVWVRSKLGDFQFCPEG